MKNATAITGATGEYYVAAYLSALGLVVALPRGGVPLFDLLVADTETGKSISLQIKTAKNPLNPSKKHGDYYAWDVSKKVLEVSDVTHTHWYAFVSLNDWTNCDKKPDIFFVSVLDVAENVKKEENNKPNATRLFYCPLFTDAEHFKGNKGVEKMLKVLQS